MLSRHPTSKAIVTHDKAPYISSLSIINILKLCSMLQNNLNMNILGCSEQYWIVTSGYNSDDSGGCENESDSRNIKGNNGKDDKK